MDAFIKLKKTLKSKKTFHQFQLKLKNYHLTDSNYLTLLLANVIDLQLMDFHQYLQLLLKAGANINFNMLECKDFSIQVNLNILMYASYKSNFNIVSRILDVQDLDLNLVDSKGRNPLYYALQNPSEQQSVYILKLLLQKRPNFITYENYKTNYLKLCIQKQRLQMIKVLKLYGIDFNAKILETGRFPLQQTIQFYQGKVKQNKHNEKHTQMRRKIIIFFIQNGAYLDLLSQSQSTLRQQIIANSILQESQLFQLQKNVAKIRIQRLQIKQINDKNQENALQDQLFEQDLRKDLTTRNETIGYNKQTQENLSANSCAFDSVSLSSDSYVEEYQNEDDQEVDFNQRILILGSEIQNFGKQSEKVHQKAWMDIQPFVKQLQYIAKGLLLQVDIIGSFATGLWTKFSDIDFILVTNEPYVDISNTLGTVYLKLKKNKMIKQMVFVEEVKFPNIKIELIDELHNLQIQIAIFHIKNNGKKYVHYINEAISFYPQIKCIYFTLRALLQKFNLHDRKKRGLKTYTIFLMIYSLMNIFSNNNLGELFVNITRYYGFVFQYALQTNQKHQGVRRLNIVDPINFTNNAGGKNIDIDTLQTMFRSVYYGIRCCPLDKSVMEQLKQKLFQQNARKQQNQSILKYLFDLNKIF